MSEPIIAFDHVNKNYPFYYHVTGGIKNFLFNLPSAVNSMRNSRYEVLKDLSFEVRKGETLGIIGRNGVGKSTTLGLIAGVIKPSNGRVIVKARVSALLELGGGFHPELTGRENIMLNGILLGLTRNEVLQKMSEIIDFTELGNFINQPIKTYSSGMFARLGFSVIAHLDPEILLIDEILAVGDMEFQKKCIDKMMSFKESGVTIVFVSHSMGEIDRICDRVIWLDNKLIRMVGPPKDVILHYTKIIS
jgi:lipopolysaccharide transport system ATP-binding protein